MRTYVSLSSVQVQVAIMSKDMYPEGPVLPKRGQAVLI